MTLPLRINGKLVPILITDALISKVLFSKVETFMGWKSTEAQKLATRRQWFKFERQNFRVVFVIKWETHFCSSVLLKGLMVILHYLLLFSVYTGLWNNLLPVASHWQIELLLRILFFAKQFFSILFENRLHGPWTNLTCRWTKLIGLLLSA